MSFASLKKMTLKANIENREDDEDEAVDEEEIERTIKKVTM